MFVLHDTQSRWWRLRRWLPFRMWVRSVWEDRSVWDDRKNKKFLLWEPLLQRTVGHADFGDGPEVSDVWYSIGCFGVHITTLKARRYYVYSAESANGSWEWVRHPKETRVAWLTRIDRLFATRATRPPGCSISDPERGWELPKVA